jgi:hypothetical protein
LIEALENTNWPSSSRISKDTQTTRNVPNTTLNTADEGEFLRSLEEAGRGDTGEDMPSDEEDEDLGELLSVFAEIQRIREGAMSNNVSDEERKQRAENMAVKLSQMLMGLDDDDN